METRDLSMWMSMFLSLFPLQSLVCLAWSMQRPKPAAVGSAAAGERQPNALCCVCSVWGMGYSRLRCSTGSWVWAQGTLPSVCRAAERPPSILAGLTLHSTLPTSSWATFGKTVPSVKMMHELVSTPVKSQGSLLQLKQSYASHLQHILVSLGFCAWEYVKKEKKQAATRNQLPPLPPTLTE